LSVLPSLCLGLRKGDGFMPRLAGPITAMVCRALSSR
jgi:hypothetical protein